MGILSHSGSGGAVPSAPAGPPEEVYCPPDQIAGPREILLRRCIQSAPGSVYFIPMTAGAPWSYLIGILSDSSSGGPIPSAPAGPPEEVYCPSDHQRKLCNEDVYNRLHSPTSIPMTAGAPGSYLIGILSHSGTGSAVPSAPSRISKILILE